MAKITKACKGVSYPKSSSVSKRLGSPSKAKNGKSFPDLNKDGKVTKKDVLIGRGVLPKTAKKGMKVKKAQNGDKSNLKYDIQYEKGVFGSSGEGYDKTKKSYNAGKTPKYEWKVQTNPRALVRNSVDTTGYAAGRKEFPGKRYIKDLQGKEKFSPDYFTTNRDAIKYTLDKGMNKKTTILPKQKTGGKTKSASKKMVMKKGGKMTKKCKYGCK